MSRVHTLSRGSSISAHANGVVTPTQGASLKKPLSGTVLANVGARFWRVSETKPGAPVTVGADEMIDYPFVAAQRRVCTHLVIDIDRPDAILTVWGDLAALGIEAAWVLETSGEGRVQVGVAVDPVDMRPTPRDGAQRFVVAVGFALRAYLGGDPLVDPVSPVKFRNPVYVDADVHPNPAAPAYRLGALKAALVAADAWTVPRFTGISTVPVDPGGVIPKGERNDRVFDACRFAAYRGEDCGAAAWEAADRCEPPLSCAEVEGVIASVERFMGDTRRRARPTGASTALPPAMRDALSDMGRRGGTRNSEAQRVARSRGPQAAAAVRSAQAVTNAEKIRQMTAGGASAATIADALGCSVSTVRRARRGGVTTGASGIAAQPAPAEQAAGEPRGCGAPGVRFEVLRDPEGEFWDFVVSEGASRSDLEVPGVALGRPWVYCGREKTAGRLAATRRPAEWEISRSRPRGQRPPGSLRPQPG